MMRLTLDVPTLVPRCLIACALLAPFGLLSCTQDMAVRRQELAEISEHHAQELSAFQQAQAAFTRANPTPRRIDFPGQGTILIHENALDGPPARAEVWLRYTWVNTTDHPIDEVVVTIMVHDPTTDGLDHGQDMHLRLPLMFRFTPDSSYTTSIGVPTEGLHLHPGWSWDVVPKIIASAPAEGGYSRG
jgi:hypothetical protein